MSTTSATIQPYDVGALEDAGIPTLPAEREALRRHLLEAIARIRPILEADAEASDAGGTLAWPSVVALYQEGLLSLKAPLELGGPEVDPLLYLELIDEISYINPSAGWCTFINSTSTAWKGAFLPDTAVDQIFADGRMPITSGSVIPRGLATPVDGGWRVSGRWPFASGSGHSSWMSAGFRIVRDGAPGPEHMVMAVRIDDVQFIDNWQVMGLQGTGSRDFVLNDHFLPEDFAFNLLSTDPRRGGALFWLGRPGFVTTDHAAFALGVARRALDEIALQAGSYQRGYLTDPIAHRGALQHDLGKCDQQLRAARALCRESLEDAWEFCQRQERPDLERQLRLRGACAFATDVACQVATTAFRYGGGNAIYNDRVLQRCMRDVNAAAQHFMVNKSVRQYRPVPPGPTQRKPDGVTRPHLCPPPGGRLWVTVVPTRARTHERTVGTSVVLDPGLPRRFAPRNDRLCKGLRRGLGLERMHDGVAPLSPAPLPGERGFGRHW